MIIKRLRSWWRSLPQKTRVQLIASVLLVFAGTEVLVLAPYILDIALMIDVGGFVIVLAAFRSSVSVSMMQVRALVAALFKPALTVSRAIEAATDFGVDLSPKWQRSYLFVDRISTKFTLALLVFLTGLFVTKVIASI